MKAIFKHHTVYLLLLPVSFLLHRYNDLFGFLRREDIVLYVLYVYGFTIAAYLAVYILLRSAIKSALIIFFVDLLLLYFGAYHDFVKEISGGTAISRYSILLPITLLLLIAASVYLIKRPPALQRFSLYLTVLFTVLVGLDLFSFFRSGIEIASTGNRIYPGMPISQQYVASGLADSLKPDIYYIVMDEYTSNRALSDLWKFDNSGITSWLLNNGFYVIPGSRSNYDFTPFSVSSTFNMQYVDSFKGQKKYTPVNMLQAVKSISENETFAILQKENYTVRFIAPFSSSIENSGIPKAFDDFSEKQLYAHTLPARIERDILWNFRLQKNSVATAVADSKNKMVKGAVAATRLTIQKIEETADTSGNRRPRFVYGHFMITHKPHFFDSTGKVLPLKAINFEKDFFNSYVQQVIYANSVIRDLVGVIKKVNRKNTVIIIQGDHGFRDLPDSMQRYHFPNFSAIYFPDGNYNGVYDSMSSVNTFRVVLNHYFRQKLPYIKDTSIAVKFKL